MRSILQLRCLGGVEIHQAGVPVTGFATQKALALFVYLAVTRQSHTRDHLATLLWGDLADAAARRALRYALWNLRQILPSYLNVTRHTIGLQPHVPLASDAYEFAADTAQLESFETPPDQDLANWRRALELYRGEFLEGFHLRDAGEFDEWLSLTRERFHRTVLHILSGLVQYETAHQNYTRAIADARRWLELEAWNEDAHRALIQLYALNGDTGAARAQYETCRRILAAEFNTEPDAATRALAAGLSALTAAVPAPVPARPKKNNLPVLRTPFFGRATESTRIIEKIQTPTCRLITLTGEGGIGKTRLALEAAYQLTDRFADGVWFVPLAGVEARDQDIPRVLARAIGRALDLIPDSAQDVTRQVMENLRPRKLLLVLDNLEPLLAQTDEHAPDSAAWIDELLNYAPEVCVLATSRTPLKLQAEYVLRLDGLELPPGEQAAPLHTYSSVQLFLERAERAGVSVSDLDLAQIARLCQLVEGLPLAIELAAAWMNRAAPQDLLQTFETNLDRLATTQRDVPARHRSLRAVFENSWRLLSRAEQAALAQAAVFQYRFTREAAEKIIAPNEATDSADSAHVAGLPAILDTLVEKSLVRWIVRDRVMRLHPLIRQYAQEKLLLPSQENVRRRHARYFLEQVAAKSAALLGSGTHNAINEIHDALADIRAAWEYGTTHREIEKLEQACDALTTFYEYAGLASEGLALLERTTNELNGDATIPQTFHFTLALARATLMLRVRQYVQAQEIAEYVLHQAQVSDRRVFAAQGRYLYALALARLPDTEMELANLEQARLEAQAAQQTRLEALCLYRTGLVQQRAGEYDKAKDYFLQAQHIFETLDDLRLTGRCASMLGLVEQTLGNFPNAFAAFSRAIEIAKVIGDTHSLAVLLANLGLTLAAQGQYEQAAANAAKSLEQYQHLNSPLAIGAQAYHGLFLALQGDWVQASELLQNIITVQDPAQKRYESAWAYWGLTLLARRQGQPEQAVHYANLALGMARHWEDVSDQAAITITLADALFEQGALQEAQTQYAAALRLYERTRQTHLYPEAMTGLAHIALRCGELETARTWLNRIWSGETLRLAQGPLEPFWLYWNAVQVMRALNDPRAERLLQTAQDVLAEYASQITDPRIRDQYLAVPWHRALLSARTSPQTLSFVVVSSDTSVRD